MAEQTDSREPVVLDRQTWRPQRPWRCWVGPGVLVILVTAEGLLVRHLLTLPLSLAAVALAPTVIGVGLVALGLAARLHGCLTLRYVLDESTLVIIRGRSRWQVPLAAIENASIGESRAVLARRQVVPGFAMGGGYIKDGGPALFFTTMPAAESVSVRTARRTYVLSPHQADDFVAALAARQVAARPAEETEPGPGYLVVLGQPLASVLAALAVLANLALYAYVVWWYPALADHLPMHVTAAGLPDRWGSPDAVVWLPRIGSVILVGNVMLALLPPLRRPRPTVVLLTTAVLVQVLLWVAFVSLLP